VAGAGDLVKPVRQPPVAWAPRQRPVSPDERCRNTQMRERQDGLTVARPPRSRSVSPTPTRERPCRAGPESSEMAAQRAVSQTCSRRWRSWAQAHLGWLAAARRNASVVDAGDDGAIWHVLRTGRSLQVIKPRTEA